MRLRFEGKEERSRRILEQKGPYSMPLTQLLNHVDNLDPSRRKERFWESLVKRFKTK